MKKLLKNESINYYLTNKYYWEKMRQFDYLRGASGYR